MIPYILLLFFMTPQQVSEDFSSQLSEMVGKNFLDQIATRDYKRASKLLSERVNFDGEIISGAAKIEARLKKMVMSHKAKIKFRRTFFFTGIEALKKFGPLPKRMKSVEIKNTSVILGRRRHGGLAVFIKKIKDKSGTWPRIVALTD